MEHLLIFMISLAAFFLKGVTGTGTTTVIVALASLFIDPKMTIVLASFINIFGGLSMVRVDPVPLSRRYWMPISLVMIVGSVVGAITLDIIPRQQFQLILGGTFLLIALWFVFRIPAPREISEPPTKAIGMDLGVGAAAGFCGGFIGINAPPLVLHFSRSLDKRRLRRLLVLIFIPAAMAQTATFIANGLFSRQVLVWGLLMLPAMCVGIWLGNRTFQHVSESMFRRTLGLLLVFVSIRLIVKGMSPPIL
ncbi:MAG: sulfite exporter TauE/SafE family protein [Desulforhopalus sp.]